MKTEKDDNPIKLLPKLPDEIKVAYENKQLVVFVGAGISSINIECGYPQLLKS